MTESSRPIQGGMGAVPDWLRSAALLSSLYAVVFLYVPTELYFGNRQDWNYDRYNLVFLAMSGLIPLLVLFVAQRFVETRSRRWGEICAFGSLAFALIILLNDVLAPLQLDVLDGANVASSEPFPITLQETLVFIGIVMFSVVAMARYRRQAMEMGTQAAMLFLLASLIYFFVALASSPGAVSGKNAGPANQAGNSARPNIYHFVLDGMQTDAFKLYLERSGNVKRFFGFDLFSRNTANYAFTQDAIKSMLSGRLYGAEDSQTWNSNLDEGLWQTLRRAGYRLTVYGKEFLRTDTATRFVSVDEVMSALDQRHHPQVVDFVQLWFARIMPNACTNYALGIGRRLGELADRMANRGTSGYKVPKTRVEGRLPFAGVLLMRKALEEEVDREPSGEYLYVHPILPHGPYAMDEQCAYKSEKYLGTSRWEAIRGDAPGYFDQVQCAGKLLTEFFDELRRLSRYDESIIVIHGDHGHGHQGIISYDGDRIVGSRDALASETPLRPEFREWTEEEVRTRLMALLMVKRPGITAPLSFESRPSQLIDVYPTIARTAGLKPESRPLNGLDLYGPREAFESRQPVFYYSQQGRLTSNFAGVYSLKFADEFEDSELLFLEDLLPQEEEEFGKRALYMGLGEARASYRFEGMSAVERDVVGNSQRWSSGSRSTLFFPHVQARFQQNAIIEFVARPFTTMEGKQLTVSSGVGETSVKMRSGLGHYQLPIRLKGNEPIRLRFDYQAVGRPSDFGPSKDERMIGLLWRDLCLRPLHHEDADRQVAYRPLFSRIFSMKSLHGDTGDLRRERIVARADDKAGWVVRDLGVLLRPGEYDIGILYSSSAGRTEAIGSLEVRNADGELLASREVVGTRAENANAKLGFRLQGTKKQKVQVGLRFDGGASLLVSRIGVVEGLDHPFCR